MWRTSFSDVLMPMKKDKTITMQENDERTPLPPKNNQTKLLLGNMQYAGRQAFVPRK
jgi:hypothetical protein